MKNEDFPQQVSDTSQSEVVDKIERLHESLGITIAAKLLAHLMEIFLWLSLWFFIGGLLTFAPLISHNIVEAAGSFILYGTFLAWATLPVTGLIALVSSNSVTVRIFGTNVLVWLLFLAFLYIALSNPHPHIS